VKIDAMTSSGHIPVGREDTFRKMNLSSPSSSKSHFVIFRRWVLLALVSLSNRFFLHHFCVTARLVHFLELFSLPRQWLQQSFFGGSVLLHRGLALSSLPLHSYCITIKEYYYHLLLQQSLPLCSTLALPSTKSRHVCS
jgi:hypothetical protein